MRNSLAEDVLDKRMLFLMEVFDILHLKTILQVKMPAVKVVKRDMEQHML